MRFLLPLLFLSSQAFAVIRYVDNAATGLNNGTSWANAWTHPALMTGVGPGDIVYVSGGSAGQQKIYQFNSPWNVPDGNASAQLTIAIGEEAGHNGTVVFRRGGSTNSVIDNPWYVTFDFWHNNQMHAIADGGGNFWTNSPSNPPNSVARTKLLGIWFQTSRIWAYYTRETEIGWCEFGMSFAQGGPVILDGGPGWIVGIGAGDYNNFASPPNNFAGTRTLVHDTRAHVFYRQGVDVDGDNGDDIMQNVGALDFYNNDWRSEYWNVQNAGNNHQDFIQTDGWNGRLFNNYFENCAQYILFYEFVAPVGTAGGASNWYFFNNVCVAWDPYIRNSPGPQAVGFSAKPGDGFPNPHNWYGLKVFNNTIIGYGRAVVFGNQGFQANYTDCQIANNITTGGQIVVYTTGAGVIASDCFFSPNVVAGANWFVNAPGPQVPAPSNPDFHLTSAAVGALGTALVSPEFTAITSQDKDGNFRGAQWDMGAYEFAPSVGPGLITFSSNVYSVAEGVGNATITVNRVNGSSGIVAISYNTSNNSATAGTDYAATSGNLTWASGDAASKTFSVPITQDSDFEGAESFTVTLSAPSGGAILGAFPSAIVTIVDDEPPVIPLMGSLNFEAEAGLIESPFTTTPGTTSFISQDVDSNLGEGGLARWRVTIPATGAYKIIASVNCPTTGADSLWISFDGEPTATDIWDVGVTTGFQDKTVTWRGSGNPATPEFSPKFWTLSSGIHTLYIRGREPGMQINSIQVVAETPPTDTAAPTPNPPVWELVPAPVGGLPGQFGISMRAATCTDASEPVEYMFTELTGHPGATNSGWQQSRDYTDTDLTPGQTYTYTITARDSLGNTTSASAGATSQTNTPTGTGTINATNLRVIP